jgi:hypothetical protein
MTQNLNPKDVLILSIIKQGLMTDKSYEDISNNLNKFGYNYNKNMVQTFFCDYLNRCLSLNT